MLRSLTVLLLAFALLLGSAVARADFFAEDDRFDLILVADVLYDRANLPLLDQFLSRGRQALVADSRVRDFRHPLYRRLDVLDACTWPDLAEPAEFRLVSLYHAERGQA